MSGELELVTGAEIARRLGVSRERVRQWASNERQGFPVSLGRFGSAKLWYWRDVEDWYRQRQAAEPAPHN